MAKRQPIDEKDHFVNVPKYTLCIEGITSVKMDRLFHWIVSYRDSPDGFYEKNKEVARVLRLRKYEASRYATYLEKELKLIRIEGKNTQHRHVYLTNKALRLLEQPNPPLQAKGCSTAQRLEEKGCLTAQPTLSHSTTLYKDKVKQYNKTKENAKASENNVKDLSTTVAKNAKKTKAARRRLSGNHPSSAAELEEHLAKVDVKVNARLGTDYHQDVKVAAVKIEQYYAGDNGDGWYFRKGGKVKCWRSAATRWITKGIEQDKARMDELTTDTRPIKELTPEEKAAADLIWIKREQGQ